LWLAAARCCHWGYMGVVTHVGGAPRPYVIVGGAWGHGSHYPHPRQSWCTVSRFGGGATLPPHCRGWDRMQLQLTLAEGILVVASSWPSLGSLTSSSWLGSHAAHGLGRESQQRRHGWDHMRSASERRWAAGSLLSGSRAANLKASWRGGQGLMPLVAGIDAAVSSLLSSLQWSCPPSPYAP